MSHSFHFLMSFSVRNSPITSLSNLSFLCDINSITIGYQEDPHPTPSKIMFKTSFSRVIASLAAGTAIGFGSHKAYREIIVSAETSSAQESDKLSGTSRIENYYKGDDEHNTQREKSKVSKSKIKRAIKSSISIIERFMVEKSVPGLVVGVSYKGQNIWVKGFGFSNLESGKKCNSETVMRIASISKSITMLLVAKLIEEGKLDLDKSIHEYLTEDRFPKKKWEGNEVTITLRQLVSHLGGIRHYKDPDKKDETSHAKKGDQMIGEFDLQEYYIRTKYSDVYESLKIFKDDDLMSKPGTEYLYTTFGWTLISAIVQSVLPEGEDFGKYLVRKILNKELGMIETYLDENEPLISNRANYYNKSKKSGVLSNSPFVENSYKWAGGGLLSTIPDLLKFGNVMMYSYLGGNGKLPGFLKQDTVDTLWTPNPFTKRDSSSKFFSKFFSYGQWFQSK